MCARQGLWTLTCGHCTAPVLYSHFSTCEQATLRLTPGHAAFADPAGMAWACLPEPVGISAAIHHGSEGQSRVSVGALRPPRHAHKRAHPEHTCTWSPVLSTTATVPHQNDAWSAVPPACPRFQMSHVTRRGTTFMSWGAHLGFLLISHCEPSARAMQVTCCGQEPCGGTGGNRRCPEIVGGTHTQGSLHKD